MMIFILFFIFIQAKRQKLLKDYFIRDIDVAPKVKEISEGTPREHLASSEPAVAPTGLSLLCVQEKEDALCVGVSSRDIGHYAELSANLIDDYTKTVLLENCLKKIERDESSIGEMCGYRDRWLLSDAVRRERSC